MLTNHELHTLCLITRQAGPDNQQLMERRAALKAQRQAEFQRILGRNQQIRREANSGTQALESRL